MVVFEDDEEEDKISYIVGFVPILFRQSMCVSRFVFTSNVNVKRGDKCRPTFKNPSRFLYHPSRRYG